MGKSKKGNGKKRESKDFVMVETIEENVNLAKKNIFENSNKLLFFFSITFEKF